MEKKKLSEKRREVCLPATTLWNAFHTPFAFNKAIKFLVQQDIQSKRIILPQGKDKSYCINGKNSFLKKLRGVCLPLYALHTPFAFNKSTSAHDNIIIFHIERTVSLVKKKEKA